MSARSRVIGIGLELRFFGASDRAGMDISLRAFFPSPEMRLRVPMLGDPGSSITNESGAAWRPE
jgi:hypothetical protein